MMLLCEIRLLGWIVILMAIHFFCLILFKISKRKEVISQYEESYLSNHMRRITTRYFFTKN